MSADRQFRMLRAFWGDARGFVFYATSRAGPDGKPIPGSWKDHWFQWPEQERQAHDFLDGDFADRNLYFGPTVFSQKTHHKAYALGSRWLWADMDGTPLGDIAEKGLPDPSVLFETSPGRYHAYWHLDQYLDPETAEAANKGIAYTLKADKSGWDISQVLRVPYTRNQKFQDEEVLVKRLRWKPSILHGHDAFRAFEMAPGVAEPSQEDLAAIIVEADALDEKALIRQWADQIPKRALKLLRRPPGRGDDRSARLHELEMLLAEAGLPAADIFALVRSCPWNKFKGRVSEETQLAREVAKALAEVEARDEPSDDDELPDDLDALFPLRVEFMRTPLPPPAWLIADWFPVGTQGIISAESGTYKSWLALDLAISVASGTPFLGQFPVLDPGGVTFIQEENAPNDVQGRVARIEKARGISTGVGDPVDYPLRIANIAGFDLTNPDHRDRIERIATRSEQRLIILDPFYMMLGDADENSGRDIRPVITWAKGFTGRHPRTGLWIVHHTNKASVNARAALNMRGHSSLSNWAGNTVSLSILDPRLMTLQVERRFRSFAQPPLASIHFGIGGEANPDRYEVLIDRLHETTRQTRDKTTETTLIMRHLVDLPQPRTGASVDDLRAALNISDEGINRAIGILITKGEIKQVSDGSGAARAFRYRMKLPGDDTPTGDPDLDMQLSDGVG